MSDETKIGEANAGFEGWLPLTAVRLAPGEYKITARDGTVLWYMEGRSLAEWVCATLNAAAVISAAREYVTTLNRYESELKHDYSGQLSCGTRMLLTDDLAKLRAAVAALTAAEEGSTGNA